MTLAAKDARAISSWYALLASLGYGQDKAYAILGRVAWSMELQPEGIIEGYERYIALEELTVCQVCGELFIPGTHSSQAAEAHIKACLSQQVKHEEESQVSEANSNTGGSEAGQGVQPGSGDPPDV